MAKFTIKDTDKGYDKFVKSMKELAKRPSVKVGVIGGKADQDHDGVTNVQIATFHEFGTENVPPRSFLRAPIDNNKNLINNFVKETVSDIVWQKYDIWKGLGRLGSFVVGIIQKTISAGIDPPLSDRTIAKKGSSTPLVDTGQLRQSISYEVEGR